MVFISNDNSDFRSSLIEWSPNDPYNFYIDAQSASAMKLDTYSDEEQDVWANFHVSVLMKHGSRFMHITKAPLSVIQRKNLITMDEAVEPNIIE